MINSCGLFLFFFWALACYCMDSPTGNYIPKWNKLPVINTLEEAKSCIPSGQQGYISPIRLYHKGGRVTQFWSICSKPAGVWGKEKCHCVSLPNEELLKIDPKYSLYPRDGGSGICACGEKLNLASIGGQISCDKCGDLKPDDQFEAAGKDKSYFQ